MKLLSRTALLAVLAACATTNKVTVTAKPGLTIGLVNYGGSATASADAEVLRLFLADNVGRDVAAKVFATETELAHALAAGDIDIAWMPPISFVAAQGQGQVKAIAKVVRRGLPFYRGVLFVRADSPVSTLKDLQGLRVAWVEKNSAAGYLFPKAALVQAGFKPSDLFKSETWAGDHAAVCNAVLSGQVDVGATYADDRGTERMQVDGCLQSAGDVAKGLRIVAVSAPIPNDVIAVRPDLPAADAALLEKVFLGLGQKPDDAKVLGVFRAESFLDVGPFDFEPVRFAVEAASK